MTSSLSITSNMHDEVLSKRKQYFTLSQKPSSLPQRSIQFSCKEKKVISKETRPFLPAHLKGESFVISRRDALSLMHFKDNSTFSVHHIGRFV